ncbi:hypothetical protein ACHAWX_002165 [Stephanocyclus meneghinianus]
MFCLAFKLVISPLNRDVFMRFLARLFLMKYSIKPLIRSGGCMAAMNQGANDGNGKIVGVIHEMFVVDGSDWLEGSHSVFAQGGKHKILVARGDNLQERKRLLVEGADALVVLPGGPGTWDELWEMACARHIGLHHMPIVCVNVDGYYDNFLKILQRAHEEELLYKHPTEIVHFEETPEAAVRWIEIFLADPKNVKKKREVKKRSSMLKRMESDLSGNALSVWGRMTSFFGDANVRESASTNTLGPRLHIIAVFAAGLSCGVLIGRRTGHK